MTPSPSPGASPWSIPETTRAPEDVSAFQEKPKDEGGWINGGFFVLSPKVIDEVKNDRWMFEREVIEPLVARGEVQAFLHHGFWQAMDTLRDKQQLEELWASGKAPWKSW